MTGLDLVVAGEGVDGLAASSGASLISSKRADAVACRTLPDTRPFSLRRPSNSRLASAPRHLEREAAIAGGDLVHRHVHVAARRQIEPAVDRLAVGREVRAR